MNRFAYFEPSELHQALKLLVDYGDEAKVIAGGTGLINLMKQGLVQPAYLIGLRKIEELSKLSFDDGLSLGAMVTIRAVETAALVKQHATLLADACAQVATVRIRTMATIGGAVAHADPHQDVPPALIALDAQVRLRSMAGERAVPLDQFFLNYYETAIQPGELITAIHIPPQPDRSSAIFLKFLPSTQDDYATVSVAARIAVEGGLISNVRVALGAVGMTPIRASVAEDELLGRKPSVELFRHAASLVSNVIDPIPSFRGSAVYKKEMAALHVRRALERTLERIGKDP